MTSHRAVIAAGPAAIRRLCCEADEIGDIAAIATQAIDDPVALLDEHPVAIDEVWSAALRMLCTGHDGETIVVHPSWWSARRIGVVAAAAATLSGEVVVRPRSWLLAAAGKYDVSVEVTEKLVVVIGPHTVAVPSLAEPGNVVDETVRAINGMTTAASVLIDAPNTVTGARSTATAIKQALLAQTVVVIDDARLTRLAGAAASRPAAPLAFATDSRVRTSARITAAAAVVAGLGLAVPAVAAEGPRRVAVSQVAPTTVLVEGRVTLTIPAGWVTQRVVSGPGSARVQVTSPADPEVALHVTQSPTPGETLSGAAERLRRAIESEPAGVFVDFDPAGSTAGRRAVTYREVRAAHDVRWTVLIDGSVRISIGCQSRTHDPGAIRDACEQAVRSARPVE